MSHRESARSAGRVPDFIGIGAEKAGTTSLHYSLRAHPEIGVARWKETRFFEMNWHRGVDWYLRQFPSDKKVLVESHGGGYTDYPRQPGIPERIASVAPDAKFIYLVRDPIDRIVSRWVHEYSNSVEHRSFEEALANFDGNHYVDQSRYFFQIERYLPIFSADRFFVFTSEEFRKDRRAALRPLFRFLGVDENFSSPEFEVVRHPSAKKRRNTPLGMALQRTVGDRIFGKLHDAQRHWFKKVVYTAVSRPIVRPTPSPELRRRLREFFEPDVHRLEEFAGRRFDGWLV